MRRNRLDVPRRLARQALDRTRLELGRVVAERRHLEEAHAALRDTRARETFEDAAELHLLASYHERSRKVERDLIRRLCEVSAEETALGRRLGERRLALRRLELLEERERARARGDAARREQRDLDDLVLIRRAQSAR